MFSIEGFLTLEFQERSDINIRRSMLDVRRSSLNLTRIEEQTTDDSYGAKFYETMDDIVVVCLLSIRVLCIEKGRPPRKGENV